MSMKRLLAIAALAWGAASFAQDYPGRPVTIVVPAPPGGVIDVLTRMLAEGMSKRMGQTVIVDNKPGASGMVAAQTVARASPDGYTLLVSASTPILYAPYMVAKMAYDVRRDLSFVSQLYTGQLLLAVNGKSPSGNIKDLVAWADKNKGKVTYGSYGIGSSGHLIGAFLSQSRNLEMIHVPYKGEPQMLQDLMSGQLTWAVGTAGTLQPLVESGRLRALAVLGDRRVKTLPNVPTMAEAGFPEPELMTVGWIGMMAPAGVPAPILARLEKESLAVMQTTEMKARLQVYGMDLIAGTSAEFRRDFEAAAPMIERLIRNSGAKVE